MIKKRVLPIALLAVTVLTGCSGKFDEASAAKYTEGMLNACYKGEFEQYLEYVDIGEEEAQKQYEENVESVFLDIGVGDLDTDSMIAQRYRKVFKELLAQADYEIIKAEKVEGGFDITVAFRPIILAMEDILTKASEEIYEDEKVNANEMTEEELQLLAIEGFLRVLDEEIATADYGMEEKMILHMKKQDKVYKISEKELIELDNRLFDI